MAAAGSSNEGIAEMHRTVSHPMIAEGLVAAVMLVALAETCGRSGHLEEGLDLVRERLATAERVGLRVADADLHRLKGELLSY